MPVRRLRAGLMVAREDTAVYDLEWTGRPEPWVLPFLEAGFETLKRDTEAGEVLGASVVIKIRRPKQKEEEDVE